MITKTNAEIIIGADSVVVLQNEIIGKPSSEEHAIAILSKLQGNKHMFTTGMTVVDTRTKTMKTIVETTEVTFSTMNIDLITPMSGNSSHTDLQVHMIMTFQVGSYIKY